MAVIPFVGLIAKASLRIIGASTYNLETLQEALEDKNKGVLTLSNHISVVDEPLMWGGLPVSQYFRPSRMRWTLGASEIMFTNPLSSAFFRSGQVLETFRGKGVYQPAVENAISKLNDGLWVHMFPEGKVNQSGTNPKGGLFRLKWGISRIVMDTERFPTIIPVWLTHFNLIMPEPRSAPRFLPRIFAPRMQRLRPTITFGAPITFSPALLARLEAYRMARPGKSDHAPLGTDAVVGVEQEMIPGGLVYSHTDAEEVLNLRRDMTQELQAALDALGREVLLRESR